MGERTEVCGARGRGHRKLREAPPLPPLLFVVLVLPVDHATRRLWNVAPL